MKSFKELDAICDIIVNYMLSREQLLFMNFKQKIETDNWLGALGGASSAFSYRYKDSNLECDRLHYRGIIFYIISTGFVDETIDQSVENESIKK